MIRIFLLLLLSLSLAFINCIYTTDTNITINALYINEFMIANEEQSNMTDSDGDFLDWVELYNGGNSEINLESYSISDSDSLINAFSLPNITLLPGEYYMLWGGPSSNEEELDDHIGFGFSTSIFKNEKIIIFETDTKIVIDSVNYLSFITNLDSPYGRIPDGSSNWEELPYPTPLSFNHK